MNENRPRRGGTPASFPDVREFLGMYRDLEREVASKTKRIERLRREAVSISTVLTFGGSRGTGSGDRVCTAAVALAEASTDLEDTVREKLRAMKEIEELIGELKDPVQRTVLRSYYLDGTPMGELAEELGYSRVQLSRIHGKGLEEAELLLRERALFLPPEEGDREKDMEKEGAA